MPVKHSIFIALFVLSISVFFANCDTPTSNTPETMATVAAKHLTDSIVNTVKKDITYKVIEANVVNGILHIAIANPATDVVGHFNILYDLHIARVIHAAEDRTVMRTNGITGIAVCSNNISESEPYKDLIWEDSEHELLNPSKSLLV